MNKLYFITSNAGKFAEAKRLMPELEQLAIDLPEVQSLDLKEIIAAKLDAAASEHRGSFIVDDTSLVSHGLNGLPGTLIKWFLETVGSDGIHSMVQNSGDNSAEASCIIGYRSADGVVKFFEGKTAGTIVSPRSNGNGHGWNDIFQPEGYTQTYAEMTPEQKLKMSHRPEALRKLKRFLEES